MAELAGKRSGTAEVDLTKKKGKKNVRRSAQTQDTVEASLCDFVRVIPCSSAAEEEEVSSVQLSTKDKAAGLELATDRLSVTGWKGFRSVRATHGFHEGTYYCEVTVQHLGETGHCRVGWSSKQAEINAPVGYDQHGFGYRDLEGSKVHKALREEYGQDFRQGDVLGLFLHMPQGGKALDVRAGTELARYKGALYEVQPEQAQPRALPGSLVVFTLNGVMQGVAYSDILEGTYYPTVSVFTRPEQSAGATLSLNFGPDFKHPPPTVEGCPAAAPMSDLPAQQQATADAELAASVAAATAAAGASAAGDDAASKEATAIAAANTTAAGSCNADAAAARDQAAAVPEIE